MAPSRKFEGCGNFNQSEKRKKKRNQNFNQSAASLGTNHCRIVLQARSAGGQIVRLITELQLNQLRYLRKVTKYFDCCGK